MNSIKLPNTWLTIHRLRTGNQISFEEKWTGFRLVQDLKPLKRPYWDCPLMVHKLRPRCAPSYLTTNRLRSSIKYNLPLALLKEARHNEYLCQFRYSPLRFITPQKENFYNDSFGRVFPYMSDAPLKSTSSFVIFSFSLINCNHTDGPKRDRPTDKINWRNWMIFFNWLSSCVFFNQASLSLEWFSPNFLSYINIRNIESINKQNKNSNFNIVYL